MLAFKLVYSDDYYLPIGTHVFPAEKYQQIHKRLIESGVAEENDFVSPRPASDQDILLVHTPQYVQKLKTGTLSAREELEMEIPYSPELVRAFWLAAGGSMLAADCALEDRYRVQHWRRISPCVSRSWGRLLHDSRRGRGDPRMQRDDKIRTAMTVDCDVHQGNGTAAIFAGVRVPSDPLPSAGPAMVTARGRQSCGMPMPGTYSRSRCIRSTTTRRGSRRLRSTSTCRTRSATPITWRGSTMRSVRDCGSSSRIFVLHRGGGPLSRGSTGRAESDH